MKILDDVRVVDLSRVLAGPYCAQILGDFGADVIKVESPGGGDEVRRIAPRYPAGESHYFLSLNRNKRSVVVDLKSEAGRDFLLRLVATADVVIENFRPGVLDRLGVGFEAMRTAKPDIIVCSISGWGDYGPLQPTPAFDLVVQARSGAMAANGDPDGPPTKQGLPVGDLGGGMWSAVAVLAALRQRDRPGGDRAAQHIDISLLDGLIALQGYLPQLAMLTGEPPGRTGSDHHNVTPYGRYEAKDGHLVIAVLVPQFWHRLCEALGVPELVDDPRFATNDVRREHRAELREALEAVLRTRTRAEWDDVLTAADVPHGPILDMVEALAQEQVTTGDLLTTVEHTTEGTIPVVGSPLKFDGVRPQGRRTGSPLLGEHTREVATELLGLPADEVDRLIDAGVIGADR